NDLAENTECSGSDFALNLSDPLNTKLQDRKRRTAWFSFLVLHEITDLGFRSLTGKTEANHVSVLPISLSHQ
ncbi:hypothetical protein, partial [Vibrio harveyi]|uniref:hypothetical protein n=1 Tax=Vibrio harveyi TaxID=669 RepID=UPI002AE085DD